MTENTEKTYGQILKASSIIGGAEGINLALSMVRVKFAAIFIGPVGVGLLGNFTAVQGLVGTLAGFGIQSSAVRDVAKAVGEDDQQKIGQTVLALRRVCWLTGLLGAAFMAGFSPWLSEWTFGSGDYTLQIALLGLVILFSNLSGGQMALIQGMRRIGDLARVNIVSAVTGTLISISAYAWLGIDGIVPALLLMSAVRLGVSWHFAQRIPVPPVAASWLQSLSSAGGMARLGFVLMWSGLINGLVLYLTRALITQDLGIAAVGIFGAAFALSGMLINFILGAMGADYYPRLTGVAPDRTAMTRLVNEQTEVGLLLAVPGLLATLALAPWIIQIFYSGEFLPAVELLQWFALGCLGRVLSWPLGFVMLALGKGAWFFLTETLFNALHLALVWCGLNLVGLEGTAIAFFVLYVVYIVAVYAVGRHLIGFSWSTNTWKLIAGLLPLVAVAFVGTRLLSIWPATVLGVIVTASATVFCFRGLVGRIGAEHHVVRKACRIPGMRWACGL
ncbi:MAG: O-antigen translocase [Chromatiaceae bacterium]|nr:O-antigen translocase [Chromatiaceae bacterium]